jgi:hypothetical protein
MMDRSKLIKHLKEVTKSRYGASVRQRGRYGARNKLAEEEKKKKKRQVRQEIPYEVNLNPELNSINQTR